MTQLYVADFNKIHCHNPVVNVRLSCPSIPHCDSKKMAAVTEWSTVTRGPGTRNVQAPQGVEGKPLAPELSQRPRYMGLLGRGLPATGKLAMD